MTCAGISVFRNTDAVTCMSAAAAGLYQARAAALERSAETTRLWGELRAPTEETANAALGVLLHCDQFEGRAPTAVPSTPSDSQLCTIQASSSSKTRRTLR